jgi:hypothetical protein
MSRASLASSPVEPTGPVIISDTRLSGRGPLFARIAWILMHHTVRAPKALAPGGVSSSARHAPGRSPEQ